MATFNLDTQSKNISLIEAFDCMRFFLEKYWELGGKRSDDIANLLSSLDRGKNNDFAPLDKALWDDWMIAFKIVKSCD